MISKIQAHADFLEGGNLKYTQSNQTNEPRFDRCFGNRSIFDNVPGGCYAEVRLEPRVHIAFALSGRRPIQPDN